MPKIKLILLTAIIFAISCGNSNNDSSNSSDNQTFTGIKIVLPVTTRTIKNKNINRDAPQISDIVRYRVTIELQDSDYTNTKEGLPGETIVFENIPEGDYTVRTDALNADSNIIYSGYSNTTVEPGLVTNITIELNYAVGGLTITVILPDDPRTPELDDLVIESYNNTSITLQQPTLQDEGFPSPNVFAFIGYTSSILDSNSTSDWAGAEWLTDYSKNWTSNEWEGYYVIIDNGTALLITGNSADTLWFADNTAIGGNLSYSIISPTANEITISGAIASNAIEGPIDVKSAGYQFQNLTPDTYYKIFVVAQNIQGYAVKEVVVKTTNVIYK